MAEFRAAPPPAPGRRSFLCRALALVTALPLAGALMSRARAAWPARPRAAFEAEDPEAVMRALFPGREPQTSDVVRLKSFNGVVEDGGLVPLSIDCSCADVRSIHVIAPRNPRPLIAVYHCGPRVRLPLRMRLKLAESQSVRVVVDTGDRLLAGALPIEVTVGGCD